MATTTPADVRLFTPHKAAMIATADNPQQLVNRIRGNFPQELLDKKIWCVWRLEQKAGSDKPTKVPYVPDNAGGFHRASSTDSSTWATFDDICAAYLANTTATASDDGLGCFNVSGWPEPY